jgi:hypothetical protein
MPRPRAKPLCVAIVQVAPDSLASQPNFSRNRVQTIVLLLQEKLR